MEGGLEHLWFWDWIRHTYRLFRHGMDRFGSGKEGKREGKNARRH
jgi:hypothetical protein